MKNEQGITLIALVMTVILVIVFASVGTFAGIESFKSIRTQAFVTKMIALQEKVNLLCDRYSVAKINEMGSGYLNADSTYRAVLDSVIAEGISKNLKSWDDSDSSTSNYRYFSIEDIEEIIGFNNCDVGIWLNPLTRNVIAVEGVKIDDKTYYRQYDLPGGQTLEKPDYNTNPNMTIGTDYNIYTYDNKAVVEFTKQYETVTYTIGSQSVSFANAKEIELPCSGEYIITVNDNGKERSIDKFKIAIVNKPLLLDGMKPMIVDSTNLKTLEKTNTNYDSLYKSWYNYQDKKWANAIYNDSVYVWIPRYAYKKNGTQYDISFLKEYSDITTEGKILGTEYIIAPAFKNGTATAFANGEWDKEITGIWVAKYKVIEEGSTVMATKTPKAAFDACRKHITGIANADTHLMKNSEWGAVTYLAYSEYGSKNVQVAPGNFPNWTNGTLSTTGNITGIYGMAAVNSGEIVAAGIDIKAYTSDALDNSSSKYYTKYTADLTKIKGDAICTSEVDNSFSASSVFPDATNPIFVRGKLSSGQGIFIYNRQNTGTVGTFRPVLIIEY